MTEEDLKLQLPTDTSPAANPVVAAPTREETLRFALTDRPSGESDEEKAVKAEYLGRTYFDLLQKAQRGIDPSKDDDALRAEAVYFTQAMTGQDDVYGKLWKKGGFKTGREYLEKMHDFFLNGGEKNLTKELKEFQAKSYDEQVAEAMAARSTLDTLKHAVGYGFSYALDWLHRADTEKLGHEKALQEDIYKRQVRAEYAAKLMADNAWHELSCIMPTLSADGQACAKALMDSKDNRLPEQMWAKFNNLEDQEKALICRVRTCLAPRVEGTIGNTIGDMAIGAANITANIAAAPWRFGNKIGMLISNDAFDAGFDVNELARRRQYLWQATGSFMAGGDASSGYLPQMQFEQMCQEHGFLAESLIGAVSTLPYMAAAAVPGIGVATVAMEAMSQMDDHVAMSGGDITDLDYMFSNALFGAMYAYTERLQVEGLLGGVKDMEIRQAMLKGFWNGVKDAKTVRTLTAGTLAESLQEGVQNGIMAANEALALDQDATRAFAEGFTEDFINSLGTMLVVEGGGLGFAHWKRSGFNNPFSAAGREAGREARSIDLETEYEKDMSLDRMVEFSAKSSRLREATLGVMAKQQYATWLSGGKDALIKAGIDPVSAEEWDYFFSSTQREVELDEETGEVAPDIRSEEAHDDLMRYLEHEAAKRTKKGADDALAKFDLSMENLDWVRSAWSQGAGIHRTDEEGKVQDPGAKALEELGFTKNVAKRLSEYFHYERSAAYSPAALNGIKARYDERMAGKVSAKAALARQFGGQMTTIDGADYLQFTDKDGGINLVRIDETPGRIDFAEASEGVAVDVELETGGEVTKKQWMDATEDERRKIWKRYGLMHEGSFRTTPNVKVTLPADPSVGVDSAQAATVVGVISMDSQTDNKEISDTSAAFHEVYHAFSEFAQASGLWTKEDVAFLEKKFGKPKYSTETHDEEAGAEGFRSFLARRANGALTVEDERSPFMKIYAAAAGLDARAKEKAAHETAANESELAFFHQLIAEQNKPKPNPPAPKPDLPKTAAPQKGMTPAQQGQQTTQTPPSQPSQESQPSQSSQSAQTTPQPQQGAPKTWSAYTPTGNVKVSGHWAVLDLKDVVHSNNPLYAVHMRAQLRNRKDNKAEEDTRKDIVNNFQGERLLDAPDTANGAPIVFYDDDGTGTTRPFVLSGNGRVLVLSELADRHLYDHYRNVMKKWAAANGIAVPDGQTPILVRVIDDYGGASRDKVADLSNTNSIQQYTEEEQARADAEVIKALGLARLYQANVDGTPDMTPGANDEFFSEFIRGVGDTSLYNSDRSLTQTARDRAQRALLAIAVGQGDRGRDVVKKLVEQTETLGIQRQKNAAAIMAAPVAALESNAAYAIGPDMSRAMADFMDYAEKRKAGKVGTFKDYYDQMDLIDKPSYVARELLALLGSDKSAATIAEYVRAYCKAAAMEDPAGGLFGAARTKDEIWSDAKRLVDVDAAEKRYSIAGKVAASNMGIKGAADAEAMEKAGADREDIWRKTGWWRGKDGKWRVEIPPLKMKGAKDIETALREGGNETTLGMIVDAPELFKAYPDMKNVKVRFDPKVSGSADAQYNRRLDEITIFNAGLESIADLPVVMANRYAHYYKMANSDEYLRGRITQMDGFKIEHGTLEEEREKAKQRVAKYEEGLAKRNARMLESLASRDGADSVFSSLNHEIQHAIQERELFARGASPRIDIYDPSDTVSEEAIDEYRRAAGEVEARNVQKRLSMTPEERAVTPPWETEDVPGDRQIVRYSVTAQTETPQFKNFFGDWEKDPENASKVVDKDGKPLVVYRRDNEAFTVFDFTKTQQNDAGWLGKGFYFYGDKGEAESATGYGKNLRAFYLNIRNPYYITSEEYHKLVEADDPKVSREFTERLKAEGYDGVYWNGDLRQEWAAFEPTQIKSATNNTGAFNPRNPDVRFSIAAQPAGRNKSANVSYPDAGEEISSTRFSVGAKRRDEYARILAKHRPDLRADAVLDELDKYDNPKKEKLALHWLVRGTIWLPNDEGKVDQAIEVAEKAKVDPFKYASPLALIDAHADIHPTEKRIDPSTVPELTDARDEGNGVVSYAVADTREGQAAMRRIIDTHWGKDANPWCLVARDKRDPELSSDFWKWMRAINGGRGEDAVTRARDKYFESPDEFESQYKRVTGRDPRENPDELTAAWGYWQKYNALPKRVAFKDGKLLAFMATEGMDEDQAFDDAAYGGGSELARRLPDLYAEYEQWQESEEGQSEGANFYEWLNHERTDELREALKNPSEEWWDRQDESHIGHDGLMEIAGAKGGIRYSIGGIFTGSAADYANRSRQGGVDDGPSLKKIGTGEGAQVYGYGLYGSNRRGVGITYAQSDVGRKGNGKLPFLRGIDGAGTKKNGVLMEKPRKEDYNLDLQYWADMIAWESPNERIALQTAKKYGEAIESYLEAYIKDYEFANDVPSEHLYEQTFFTNRAPGDESHLLKWYDAISDANWDRVIAQAEKEGLRGKLKGAWWLRFNGDLEHFITDNGNSGDAIYESLSRLLGGPQAASEFLARAGIDGVKYPVGTAGGKVKDGDKVGWNYVSFRDDNIRVDHKWTDGQQRYSITTLGKYNTDDLRELAHRVKEGDSAAIADAGRRLAKILPKNAVLVPMPSRTGEPTTMRALADAIAANADGATVVDALRSNPHESSYERKKRGDEPEEVEMRRVAEIPKGREVYVVDNVIDTGAMYHAAMRTIHDAHLLALADTDKTPAELRQTIAQNIDHILSRFDKAKGLSKKDIFAKFDNRQLEIGWLPSDLALPDELQVAKRSVMGAEAFILDHIHNKPGHEKQLTADDARRMLANIDPNNEMRVVPQRGSLSLAFIAPNPAGGWDCTVIAPHSGALYVFKTMFGQTRKPYQDKSLIRYSVSVRRNEAADRLIRGGLSSIRDFSETPRSISQSGAPAQGGRFSVSVSAPAVADPDVQVAKESAEQRYSVFAGEKTATPRLLKPLAEAKAMLGDGEYTDAVRREIYDKTGWWRGTDGKWRVELPNLKAKYFDADESVEFADADVILEKYGWNEYSAYWLRDLVTFPKGLKANTYELGETLVFFVDEEQMKSASGGEDASAATFVRVEQGLFGPQVTCEIHVVDPMVEDRERKGRQRLAQSTLDSLTHELQHVIQLREGFAFGGNTSDAGGDRAYGAAAGEVEARNAARRNDPQNRIRPPWATEDVPARYQSVGYSGWEWTDAEGWRPMEQDAELSPAAVRPAAERRHSITRRRNTSVDDETLARRAIRAAIADGGADKAKDALVAYVASFKLNHGTIPRPMTLAKIGLAMGMKVVDPKRILKDAERLAQEARNTAIGAAAQNGDMAIAMALIKRQKDIDKKVEDIIARSAAAGAELAHKGVGQINSIINRRVDSMMRDLTGASLADIEKDTGINIADEILENDSDKFETEYRRAKKAAGENETAEDEGKGESGQGAAAAVPFDESELSDADRYKREILLKEQTERVLRYIELARQRAEENRAKAAEARERRRVVELEGGGEEGGGEGGGQAAAGSSSDKWNPKPKDVKANFKTPEEFAAFLRVWARDKYAKTHGIMTLGKVEQDRLFAEYYRLCVRKELQDLADKLLAPKMENAQGELVTNQRLARIGNGARVWVNRRIADLEKGMRPDTIERASADIFAFINKAAIRVSRVDLITTFKQELKERFLEGAEFDEFKQDTERKLTGWLEEATRYIIRVCDLSRKAANGKLSELEQEYKKLHDILDKREKVYDESGRDVAEAAKEDAETRKAQRKLALLDKYGAMRSLMPGQILDLQNAAFDYLENEARKLEDAWKETREEQDRVRRDFAGAIVGPNGQRYDEKKHTIFGWISNRFLDSLNGMIRLRLEHLTRFASAEARAKAKDAINSVLVKLGDGEVAYARALQADREAFFAGLGEIFKREDGRPDARAIRKYLERMDEPIPTDLSRQLSNQGYAESMTFGQMLQLLVSLEQRSFKDTIEANGREGQAELIRTFRYRDENGNAVNAFTKEDDAFVNWLRAFYAANRDQISEVTERMVGQKVDSPDPLYCPIRRWMGDKTRDLHADPTQRWDPISKIFSRRVPSTRDFDESRTIVGLFFENSKESAKLTAWAERGSFIRNVVTSEAFQGAVKRAFGPEELAKILTQLEATFNGGEQRSQTPGEVAVADKAVNFTTYAYLGFNPLSALKQTTSFAVWANQLPNGFADLWRHMTHFDAKVLKHLMESEEYKVRYGNAVGSGMDYATKGINMNPSQNPVMRVLSGAGMWMLKRGDFIPGGWIAQGVYKDLLDKHLKEGMGFDAADKLATTETFNMLEETQQSGRTYNTNMLQIKHGRIGRLLTQFATSPLQQLQYETQAWREWRDMVRYNMGKERIAEARAKLRRAVVVNHVIIPAAVNLVVAMYKAVMGEEPPWEKDGFHWTLLIDLLLGQFARVFFIGAFSTATLNALLKRESPRWGQVLPIEGAIGTATTGAFLLHDLATMNVDKLQKDIERAMKATAPTRIPYSIYRRVTGDSDADRKAKKEAQKRK